MNKRTKSIYVAVIVLIITAIVLFLRYNPPEHLINDIEEAKEITIEKVEEDKAAELEIPADANPDQVRAYMEE